jgi:hypothetical protein
VSVFLEKPVSSCDNLVQFNEDMRSLLMGQFNKAQTLRSILQEQFRCTITGTAS